MKLPYQNPQNPTIKDLLDLLTKSGGEVKQDNRSGKDIRSGINSRTLIVRFDNLIISLRDGGEAAVAIDDMQGQTMLAWSRMLVNQPKVFKSLVMEYNKLINDHIERQRKQQAQQYGSRPPLKPMK